MIDAAIDDIGSTPQAFLLAHLLGLEGIGPHRCLTMASIQLGEHRPTIGSQLAHQHDHHAVEDEGVNGSAESTEADCRPDNPPAAISVRHMAAISTPQATRL